MRSNSPTFDVVVVGAGHAGIEASLASARMGCRTVLMTMDAKSIGRMSCNPAIGGSAKGHLVREIDALGGEMGKIADATGIHFRMLNKSKGPAVWSPRCQSDREWYSREARSRVMNQENLVVLEDTLVDIVIRGGVAISAETEKGLSIKFGSIVLCSGTFLNGVMHTGLEQLTGGRYGEPNSSLLSERLKTMGFQVGRLKTGTPPRVSRRSIRFEETEKQHPDSPPNPFSYSTKKVQNQQVPMYLTHTKKETHNVLRSGFPYSPMFTGRIKGIGPRYCPSIEDKINRFAEKDSHQIFLELEGYETDVVYVNGFSTSLPAEIQLAGLRTIEGLAFCVMLRPGYAVEYDFFPPHQLNHTLETKLVKQLFFAGQINGTSGYEEAAGQGIAAGINAALSVRGEKPLILERSNSYIGVMIDDLINKGTDEPYRIFTSRAEYRLKLRQDNADSRLTRIGHQLGLVGRRELSMLKRKERSISHCKEVLSRIKVTPDVLETTPAAQGRASLGEPVCLDQLLRRPEFSIRSILEIDEFRSSLSGLRDLPGDVLDRVEIEIKYDGYLKRQDQQIEAFAKSESTLIPQDFDFSDIRSLSKEGMEKLHKIKPRSIGQASRIGGVTPADLSVLLVHLRNQRVPRETA